MTSVGKGMQKLKPFYIVGGIGAAILENSLAVSQKFKHRITV